MQKTNEGKTLLT